MHTCLCIHVCAHVHVSVHTCVCMCAWLCFLGDGKRKKEPRREPGLEFRGNRLGPVPLLDSAWLPAASLQALSKRGRCQVRSRELSLAGPERPGWGGWLSMRLGLSSSPLHPHLRSDAGPVVPGLLPAHLSWEAEGPAQCTSLGTRGSWPSDPRTLAGHCFRVGVSLCS